MRLTEKYEYGYKGSCLQCCECSDKLGQLEDLMEKFEIEDVNELETILNDYDESSLFAICIIAFTIKKGLKEEFAKFVEDFKKKTIKEN